MKTNFGFWLIAIVAFLASEISLAQYVVPSDSTINAGVISSNVALGYGANTKYLLNGIVKIDGNSTLSIKPGTIIFGSPNGVGVAGGTLVIRRGSKLIADGTPSQPIVFTSSRPAGQRAAGDWGGIIILGAAVNNQSVSNATIEGLPGEVHGGTDDADNSGIIRYVRIEFAGFELSPNNEINSLTMGSVGSGTIIDHVQCSYGLDDSFEWFGGTVNCNYLVAYKTKDDCFDTDWGYRGKLQFGLSWRDPFIADQSRSEAWESDNENASGTPTPRTTPVFSNFTAIGPKRTTTDTVGIDFDVNFFHGVHQRRETLQNIFNSVIMGYNTHGIILDATQVMTDMQNGVSKFSYNYVDGTTGGVTTTGTVPGGFVAATWFTSSNNTHNATLNSANLKAPFNSNAPVLNPQTGSALINAANFSDPLLAGFINTGSALSIGAFGPDGNTNWDKAWTNYDPQNTLYGLTATDPEKFSATIFLTNSNNESRQLILGRYPGATNGLDLTLGESNLPPVPPVQNIDFRAEINSTEFSILDLRNTGTVTAPIQYKLLLQLGTSAGTLSWDPNLLGPGFWVMKDQLGTTIVADMKAANSIAVATANAYVTIDVDPRVSPAFTYASNWNLVSFPGYHPNSMLIDTLFRGRDASAQVFKFAGSYVGVTSIVPGEGYWLKMSANRSYNWNGTVQSGFLLPKLNASPRTNYAAASGWNMIGAYEYIADANFLRTSPENLRTGFIFRYVPGTGYQNTTVFNPGFAYWVRVNANCQMIYPGPFAATLSKDPLEGAIKEDWGKIVITDAAGQSYTLYSADANANLTNFELPPMPPAGLFDVRFGSQRFVEDLSIEQTINLAGAVYPITVTAVNMDLRLEDAIDGSIVKTTLNSGSSYVISNSNLSVLKVGSDKVVPTVYSLEQNYPNPFNPTTTIKFAIPEASNVKLTIYNALGQKVAELVNSTLEVGSYSFNWDASNVASGLYFYELNTNNFSSVKKMMLLK